jgi:ribosomal protein S18 acetylase RimI-like enzyme
MSEPTRAKADIVPYTSEYSTTVRSWINSEETYDLVCRGINYPPPEDVVDSWQRKGVRSFLLYSHNRPVAYGELWERQVEQALEVAHLLVDPMRRGEGFGSKMAELLYERAAATPGIARVLVNLYHEDEEVLGCLLKAGFEIVGTSEHIEGLRMMRLVLK